MEFQVGDTVKITSGPHRKKEGKIIPSYHHFPCIKVGIEGEGFIFVRPRQIIKLQEKVMEFKKGMRVVVDNPTLKLHGKEGIVRRQCSATSVIVEFDDNSAIRILRSNLLSCSDKKVESTSQWPKRVVYRSFDEGDIDKLRGLDFKNDIDFYSFLVDRFGGDGGDTQVRVSLVCCSQDIVDIIKLKLRNWDAVVGLVDDKPFVAFRDMAIKGIDVIDS